MFQGFEGERHLDPNSKNITQAKLGLDRNANKKKKKKKVAVVEEGPSKPANYSSCLLGGTLWKGKFVKQ